MKAATSKLFLFVQLIAFVYSSKDRCPEMTPQNKIKNREELKAMKGLWYTYAMIGNAPDFQSELCAIGKHTTVEGLTQLIKLTVLTESYIVKEDPVFDHSPNDLNKFDYTFNKNESYPFTMDLYNPSKYFSMYHCVEKDSKVEEMYIFWKRDNNTNLDSEDMVKLYSTIENLKLHNERGRLLDMDCNHD